MPLIFDFLEHPLYCSSEEPTKTIGFAYLFIRKI